MTESSDVIQLFRPTMPVADDVLPYLRAIDMAGIYSNYGPLHEDFRRVLAACFGVPAESITLHSSGTAGLTAALLACAPGPGFCMMPSWTFYAGAHAVLGAGLRPFFVDVDPESWQLTPAIARAELARMPGPVRAVMPTLPFGQPIDTALWEAFEVETGLPVLFDAAAAFDAVRPSRLPAVVSLHATKILGIGEGALTLGLDAGRVETAQQCGNFGFRGTRRSSRVGLNAKLSEYHAAVGLAAMSQWPDIRARYAEVALLYRKAFAELPQIQLQAGFGSDWVGSCCVVRVPAAVRPAIEVALQRQGIPFRHWWGNGCHEASAFTAFPKAASLAATVALAAETIGLPFHGHLTAEQIVRISDVIAGTLPAELRGTRR